MTIKKLRSCMARGKHASLKGIKRIVSQSRLQTAFISMKITLEEQNEAESFEFIQKQQFKFALENFIFGRF